MAQDLISEIAAIHWKLRFSMTEGQKADWQRMADKKLDALDALYKPVDQWGRSAAQQKEDDENRCYCDKPDTATSLCCAACGFWVKYSPCENCGNTGDCASWCEDVEAYWEPRTWQTCRDCNTYVCGLSDHQKTCEKFLWNETHCDVCGNLYEYAARFTNEDRCWCAYDQDDLNKMDLASRRQ